MKLTVNQKNLKRTLSIVEKAVTKNSSLPILNNVLFKTENGRLKILATNLEIGITGIIGAKIDEVGEIAVPARIITDFISTINDEKVTLSSKNSILTINSDNYKTQILGFDSKDFPIIPKIKEDPILTIPTKTLKNALLSVIDSTASSESRPELSGVFMKVQGAQAIFASTDSFRLAEKTIPIKGLISKSIILPRITVAELIRICGDIEGEMVVRSGENQISFSSDDIEIVSRTIDGTYPDYRKVIPEKFLSRVLVTRDELEKNLRLAGLFSSLISDVRLSCRDQKMFIAARNSERGEIETSVESLLKNEPFEIALNYRYLLDGLKNVPSDKVIIEFTGSGSPLLVRSGEEKSDYTYLIMPLRN